MESVKAAVHTVTEAVFPGINVSYRRNAIYRSDEVMSSLPLQMSLYFNIYFSPFWLLIRICTIAQKYMRLTQLYKIILITVIVVMTPVEVSRLYLGYVGNLTEKVPELAGFWLLTLLLQFPLHSLLLFHDGHIILPVEQAVDVLMMVFIVSEIILGYLSLKAIACHQANKFQQHMLRLEDTSSFQSELQSVT